MWLEISTEKGKLPTKLNYNRFTLHPVTCTLSPEKGFTLIELILVLVIIGFLTSLVAPAITSLAGLKLKTATRKMAAGLRYARSQAVTTGSEYQVIFDIEKGEMIIESLQEEEKPYSDDYEDGEEEEEVSAKRMKKRKTYTIPKEVRLARVVIDGEEITEDQAWIDFYPNGSCSGGEIFLMDEKEREYRIALEFITGVVKITEEEET
ncbi:MAG: GspH/FimT family pseudopilin [Deltaproteobacteria bacterium]|nr:GspH/FimT family pseudopilin [Deltaproteobacteria bacterium]